MAAIFDVESRLAEGHPTVDRIERYVRACELIGYQDAELTAHAGQVRDWFGGEDGLDLHVLEADCAALRAGLAAAEDALALQEGQLPALADAWQGRAASGSRAFLLRHGAASAQLVAELRQAADALAALREDLWYLVDGKVAAAQAIDDRRLAERGPWLAAADAVTTGAGDRATASELIDQQVQPFVDNDIRLDWVEAMRTATEAVATAFDAVIARLSDLSAAPFEVPGDLGPSWTAPPADDVAHGVGGGSGGVPTTPAVTPAAAAGVAPLAAASPAPPTFPAAAAPPAAEPALTAPAMPNAPAMPPPGGVGGGLPSVGAGFSSLGQQLADVLGSLFGSVGDGGLEPPAIDEPSLPDEPDPSPDKNTEPDDPESDEAGDTVPAADDEGADADDTDTGESADEPAAAPVSAEPEPAAPEPVGAAPTPVPAAVPPAPLAAPPAPPGPGDTPCEIAMDELPQVGG